MMHI